MRRTERAMVRATCGVKLTDRKRLEDLRQMPGLKEAVDWLAKAKWGALVCCGYATFFSKARSFYPTELLSAARANSLKVAQVEVAQASSQRTD